MIIPKENVKDLEEVPQNVREAITIVPASEVGVVLRTALCEMPKAKPVKKEETVVDGAVMAAVPAVNAPSGLKA